MAPPIGIFATANAATPERTVNTETIQEKTIFGTACTLTPTPEGFKAQFPTRIVEYTEGGGKILNLQGGRVAKPVRVRVPLDVGG